MNKETELVIFISCWVALLHYSEILVRIASHKQEQIATITDRTCVMRKPNEVWKSITGPTSVLCTIIAVLLLLLHHLTTHTLTAAA